MRIIATVCLIWFALSTWGMAQPLPKLNWQALPPIPNELGLAGPVVGVYDDVLIVGGGANFAKPVWENVKQWHRELYALDLRKQPLAWERAGLLSLPLAYCACASTPHGVAVVGGNDETGESIKSWLLKPERHANGLLTVDMLSLPDLPLPLVYGQAAWVNDHLLVLSGQTDGELSSAIAGGWQLKLDHLNLITSRKWQTVEDCPGGARAFGMLVNLAGSDFRSKLLLMGGRRQAGANVEFLRDVWQYDLVEQRWRQLADLPAPVAAGGAGSLCPGFVAVVSGDDGSLFHQTDKLKDNHPGFAKRTWYYDLSSNSWHAGHASPANQVTTPPVIIGQRMFIVSGEVRPRVRTNQVWEIRAGL